MTGDPLDSIAAVIQDGIDADTGDYTAQDEAEAALKLLVKVARAARDTVAAHYETAGWATIAERSKLWDALDAQHAALARLDGPR